MTVEQAYPLVKSILSQMDFAERKKLETMILGAVESREARKAEIWQRLCDKGWFSPYEKPTKKRNKSKVALPKQEQ